MNTTLSTYQQQLLLALRLRDVPGPQIAEALAEVDSHVAETGQDPYQAFGQPKAYARQLSEALGAPNRTTWLGLLRSMTWRDATMTLLAAAGSGLLIHGIFRAGSGDLDLPALAATVAGLVLIVALVVWMIKHARSEADPVLDPRTGNSMAPPFPRWTIGLWVMLPFGLLLLAHSVTNR